MKLNSCIKLCGKNVILVPYRKGHVKRYHEWMESEELREQTASERLTLEEEYEMQQQWLHDENKCTFIVLDQRKAQVTGDEIDPMIGDANLYIKCSDDGVVGEVGVMIAEENFRGQGRGKEATLFLLRYGMEEIKVDKFEAIISMSNSVSIQLFKKLQFEVESESLVFKEVKLSRPVDENWRKWLRDTTSGYQVRPTEPNE